MARLNNKLIIKQMPWHANMTELNHLGAALIAKPTVFEGKMTQIFTSQRYSDNTLTTLLAGKAERTITTSTWEWELKGASARPLVNVERVEPDANTTVGKFGQFFKLKLDESWYVAGDVISPGNQKYQVRIQNAAGVKMGNGYVYEVKGMWDDPAMFLPAKYLYVGQQWSKLYSQYEEGATQSGSTQYSTPIAMQNKMSRFRKKYEVTGDAAQEVLAIKIQDSKGNWHDSWIKYAEIEYWEQWYRELERGFVYSRSTDTVKGSTGRPIYTGPGMQEQLEDSNIHKYSKLSTRLLEEYLMDIFYSRVKPGKGRRIEGFSGEYGMIEFHRAIDGLNEKRGKGFISIVDTNFIGKDNSPLSSNALSYGYQFTLYRMANGAEIRLNHLPLYDDREINFEIDEITGYPKESQRITFLDFAGGGKGNIEIVNKANSFKLGYIHGLTTPYGPVNKGPMAHSGDSYEMHVQKQCGLHIDDVTRCGELILDRN